MFFWVGKKDEKEYVRKGLVLGIIVLFFGTSVVLSTVQIVI